MRILIAPAALLLAAGCVSVSTAPGPAPAPGTGPGAGRCDHDPAQRLVGQPASEALARQALSLTGARALRWIAPGMMVTMDYRPDRLNIHLDTANRASAIRCG